MNWTALTSTEEIKKIQEISHQQAVVIFKHSTRCSISGMAKSRLEREHAPDQVLFYYLDLIRYREVSNEVAEIFRVEHESPQLLLIRNGECVYNDSHNGISMGELEDALAS